MAKAKRIGFAIFVIVAYIFFMCVNAERTSLTDWFIYLPVIFIIIGVAVWSIFWD